MANLQNVRTITLDHKRLFSAYDIMKAHGITVNYTREWKKKHHTPVAAAGVVALHKFENGQCAVAVVDATAAIALVGRLKCDKTIRDASIAAFEADRDLDESSEDSNGESSQDVIEDQQWGLNVPTDTAESSPTVVDNESNHHESLVPAIGIDDAPATVRSVKTNGAIYISAFDVIEWICPGNQSRKQWDRLKPDKVLKHQFRGERQRPTPVVDADGAIMLAMQLPGKAAAQFRLKCTDVLRRYFAGDTSLSAEIAAKRPAPELAEFLLPVKKKQALLDEATLDLKIERLRATGAASIKSEVASLELVAANHQAAAASANMDRIDAIARWGSVGNTERDRVAKGDLARRLMHESSATGLTETSIPIVAAKMGVPYNAALKAKATTIGKTLKALYVKRHQKPPPKRSVAVPTHTGSTIVRENCYFEKDEDLIRTAIERELRG